MTNEKFQPLDSEDYTFSQWLDSTTDLQIKAYGVDPYHLSLAVTANPDEFTAEQVDKLADFIRWNVLAIHAELGELLDELPIWKPWSTNTGINRDLAAVEVVDILHFVANLLRVLGVDGVELTSLYKAKQLKNAARMEAGYDGVSEKCPGCKRDKMEVGAMAIAVNPAFPDGAQTVGCAGCGTAW